ncbi:hypothetical protein [Corynebacterium renale]|uniref:hypothetical protein n=1 Tax=Corynebacterium renale TaxID=1724 RepID=UPI001F1EA499|nr:hypothetical protein [Corynebacterium renale]
MTELGTTYRTSTVAPAPEEPQRSLPGLIARGLGAVAVAAVWLAPYPEGVAADARTTLGVFAVAVWLWVFSKISDTFVALLAASAWCLSGSLMWRRSLPRLATTPSGCLSARSSLPRR